MNEPYFRIAVATFQAVHSRYVEACGTEPIAKLASELLYRSSNTLQASLLMQHRSDVTEQKKLSPEELLDFCDTALDAIIAGQTPPALLKVKDDAA